MSITVNFAGEVTEELLDGLNRFLPQLSSTASPLTIGDLERIVNSTACYLFVARADDVIVGALTLVIFAIPTGVRAWIEDVVVDKGSRGTGVGEALSTAAIDEARRRGVRSIDLTSRPSREAANALYRKLGFELRDTNVYRLALES
jgi:ribosomal protein S18 acetylase RimI-like enzyme